MERARTLFGRLPLVLLKLTKLLCDMLMNVLFRKHPDILRSPVVRDIELNIHAVVKIHFHTDPVHFLDLAAPHVNNGLKPDVDDSLPFDFPCLEVDLSLGQLDDPL